MKARTSELAVGARVGSASNDFDLVSALGVSTISGVVLIGVSDCRFCLKLVSVGPGTP